MRWVLLLALVAVASLQHTGVDALTNPVDKKALLAFKAGITQVCTLPPLVNLYLPLLHADAV